MQYDDVITNPTWRTDAILKIVFGHDALAKALSAITTATWLVVGVIATKLPVAPSFHREVIVDFSTRVCVRPAERLAVW